MPERTNGPRGRRHLFAVNSADLPAPGPSPRPSFMPVHARATSAERRVIASMMRDEVEAAVTLDIARQTDGGLEIPSRRFNSTLLPMKGARVGAAYETGGDSSGGPSIAMRFTAMVAPGFRRLITLELGVDSGRVLHAVDRQESQPGVLLSEAWRSFEPPTERTSLNRCQLLVAHSILVQVARNQVDAPNDQAPYSLTPNDYLVGALTLGLPVNSFDSFE